MADKPRVKAPKQRAGSGPDTGDQRRKLLMIGGGVLAAVALAAILFVALGLSGGGVDDAAARADLEAAGCTLVAEVPADPGGSGYHSVLVPGDDSPDWNTDPPAAGAHYGQAAIFGSYEEPVEMARVVHNLEHGGIYILYGGDVAEATVDELRTFYSDHKTGTVMAPLPSLGDKIALGAWVVRDDEFDEEPVLGTGYLATCTTFDQAAFSTFFRAFQFKGPERFDPEVLRPGD